MNIGTVEELPMRKKLWQPAACLVLQRQFDFKFPSILNFFVMTNLIILIFQQTGKALTFLYEQARLLKI